MKQITIRNIEPEVEKKIRLIAANTHKSINQVLVEIIHKEFGKGKRSSRASSLKQLAGGWNREQADEFVRSIESCERIDEDLWR